MSAKITPKNATKFKCEKCGFTSSKLSDWTRHISTQKHLHTTTTTKYNISYAIVEKEYGCGCGKKYNHRSSLFNHKKKCKEPYSEVYSEVKNKIIQDESISNEPISDESICNEPINDASNNIIQLLLKENSDFKNIIMEVIKSNTELQKQNQDIQKHMIDVCQKIQPGTVNNTNSHNKIFNLQFFLNEECKDAMNMSEFINSIQLKVSDLENIGKNGYVEGVSNIIIKHLNDTDVNKRPIHCSDAKRETLYVKEENKWEKDTQETNQMLTAVRGVNKKNYQMLHKWKETHPKCTDRKSTQCDDYMKIMSKVMDGDIENINKVIKKVAKEVVIDK
jgi:hypothetical protein